MVRRKNLKNQCVETLTLLFNAEIRLYRYNAHETLTRSTNVADQEVRISKKLLLNLNYFLNQRKSKHNKNVTN